MEGKLFEMEEPASGPEAGDVSGQPLAARMRPQLARRVRGPGAPARRAASALRTAIEEGRPHSMILYGPPGTGKTTLARLLAVNARAAFEEASAVNAGRAEVREVHRARPAPASRRAASARSSSSTRSTASTRRSRTRCCRRWRRASVVLVGRHHREPLLRGELGAALALPRSMSCARSRTSTCWRCCGARSGGERGIPDAPQVDDDALEFLAARSAGDARTALSALELAAETVGEGGAVTLRVAEDALQRSAILYDKGGDLHYDLISAWIKSTRGSDPDASLLYLAAMLEGGEDPRFIARRMVVLASEDIGNADPRALEVAVSAAARGGARGHARVRAEPGPGGGVPGAGAEVERLVRGHRAAPARGCASTARPSRPRRCAAPPTRARRSSAAGLDYDYPHAHPEGVVRAGADAGGGRRRALPRALRARRGGGAPRAARADPRALAAATDRIPAPWKPRCRPAEATELESFSPLDGAAPRRGARRSRPTQVQSVVDDVARCSRSGRSCRWWIARATCAAPPRRSSTRSTSSPSCSRASRARRATSRT